MNRSSPLILRFGIVLTAFLLAACGGDSGVQGREIAIPKVAVFEVKEVSVATERQWVGMIEPLRSASITAPELGEVVALEVREGQQVKKGDILLRMDGPDLSARQSVLEERYASRREELARWQRLAEADAAGSAEVEAARLQLLEVEEALTSLQARIQAVHLVSPVNGYVSSIQAATNARVSAGDVLLRIRDVDSYGLRLLIPANETEFLREKELLRLSDASGNEYSIENIVMIENPTGPRGFVASEVWINGQPPSGVGQVILSYRRYRDTLIIPWTAVAREGEEHWVAQVEGDPPTVRRNPVRLGSGRHDGVEVVEGLSPGNILFRYEPRSQADGAEVEPVHLGR